VLFPGNRIASAHLSWRSPVRRTRATIYGSDAALEIDGDCVILTARSAGPEDLSPTPGADDSYTCRLVRRDGCRVPRAINEKRRLS
jgi:hypothetical protein